ncbi:hypothetical protein [Phaffia rhodozyma]|uniref:Uncharacterized protein n=1 Tax=Phaffia rhodozyma TaxID=264483 RepID=A0A0F7SP51_PHARH|nr:hypothetical protein [Phaffia rhodozyma]
MTVHPTTDSSTTHPTIAYTPSIVPDTFSSSSSADSSLIVSNTSPVSAVMAPIHSSLHSPAVSVGESHVRPSPFSLDSPIGTGGNLLSTLPPDSTLARELESGFDVWDGPPGHPFKLDGPVSSLGGRSEKAIQSSGERSYQEEDRAHTPSLQRLDKPGGVTWSSSSRETSSNPKQFSSLSTFTPNPTAGPSYHPFQDPTLLLSAPAASSDFPASSVSSAAPSPPNVSTPYPVGVGVSQVEPPFEARARPKPKPRMSVREKPTDSGGIILTPATENSTKSVGGSKDWSMGPPLVLPSSRAPSGLTPEGIYHTPTLSPLSIRSVTSAESDKEITGQIEKPSRKMDKLPVKRKTRDLSDEEEGDREEECEKRRLSEPRGRKHSASTKGNGSTKEERTKDRRRAPENTGDDESDPIGLSSSSKKSLSGKMAEVIDLVASSEPGDIPQTTLKSKTKTKDVSKADLKAKSKINGKGKEVDRRSGIKSATATPPRSSSSSSGKAVRAKRPMMVPSSPTSAASEPEAELTPAPVSKPPTPQPQKAKTLAEGGMSVPHLVDSQSPSLSPPPPLLNEISAEINPEFKGASASTTIVIKKSKKKGPPKEYAYETDEEEPTSRPVLAPASVWMDEHSTRRRGKPQVSYQEIPPDEIDERLMEIRSSSTGLGRDMKRNGEGVLTDDENPAKRDKKGYDDEARLVDQANIESNKEVLATSIEEIQGAGEAQDPAGEASAKNSKGLTAKKAPTKKGKVKGKGKGKASAKEIETEDQVVVEEEDMIEVEKEEEVEQIEPDEEAQKEDVDEDEDEDEKKDSSASTPTQVPPPVPPPATTTATATKSSLKRSQGPALSSSNSSLAAESPRVSIPRHRPPFKREGSAISGLSSPGPGKVQSGNEALRGTSLASIIQKHSTPLRSPSIQTSGLPKKLPPPPVKKVAKKKGDLCEDDFSEGEWEEMEKERLKRERDWCE